MVTLALEASLCDLPVAAVDLFLTPPCLVHPPTDTTWMSRENLVQITGSSCQRWREFRWQEFPKRMGHVVERAGGGHGQGQRLPDLATFHLDRKC